MHVFFSKSFFVPPPRRGLIVLFFGYFSVASPTPGNLSNFSADVLGLRLLYICYTIRKNSKIKI